MDSQEKFGFKTIALQIAEEMKKDLEKNTKNLAAMDKTGKHASNIGRFMDEAKIEFTSGEIKPNANISGKSVEKVSKSKA
jgi:hypothetical protein